MSEPRSSLRTVLAAAALLAAGALLGRSRPAEGPVYVVLSDPNGPAVGCRPAALLCEGPADDQRVALADGLADVRKFVRAAAPPPPTVQESLQKIQKSLERFEKVAPATEETLREYSDLARELRKTTIPDLQKTNEELQKLTKSINDTVPMARKTIEEANKTLGDLGTASRNWATVGERVNVLLQTNEENLQNIIKGTAKLLSEDSVKDFRTLLANMRISSERFPTVTREAEDFFKKGREAQTQLEKTLKKQEGLIDQLGGSEAGAQRRGMLRDFQEGAQKFNQLMGDAREVLRAAAQSDGTVRRLLADPSLFNNLDDATLMLKRIVPRLDRVLKDFEVFADKLARHPEALGLGGLVRPSSGIKEAPSRSHVPAGPWHQP